MTDPRDRLDEWQRLAESAKPFHRFGGVDPAMVGMLASDLLALIAAVRAVLDLHYLDEARMVDVVTATGVVQEAPCAECGDRWPCPTVRTVTDTLGGVS